MSLAKNEAFLEKWESYYEKKSPVVKAIEWVNEGYFSKYFERVFKKALGKPVKNLHILEPGCGSGIMSARLAQQGAKVYLLDISPNALKTAQFNFKRKNTVPAESIQGDLLAMPLADKCMDVVWNQGVIEHFTDRKVVVKEMFRVIKPGGKIIILVPGFLSPLHIVYLMLSALRLKKLWPFDDQDFIKQKELRENLEAVGANNIKTRRLIGSFGLSIIGYGEK